MAKNKPVVSQSRTMWVKKGQTLSNGKIATEGYLAQYGKDTRRVTARVQMKKQTGGVASGDIQEYKGGKRVTRTMGGKKPDATAGKPKSPTTRGKVTNPPAPDVKPDKKPKKDTFNTRAARDRAMANRAGMTSRRAGNRAATSATVSSAKATPRPSAKPTASQGNGSPAARIRAAVINAVSGSGGGRRPTSANGWSGFAVQPAQRPGTKAKPTSSAAAAKAEAARKAKAKAAAKAQAKWQSGR